LSRDLRSDIADQVRVVGDKTKQIAGAVGTTAKEWVGRASDLAGAVTAEVRSWKEEERRDLPEPEEPAQAEADRELVGTK